MFNKKPALFVILIGCIFLTSGIVLSIYQKHIEKTMTPCTGIVSSVKYSSIGDNQKWEVSFDYEYKGESYSQTETFLGDNYDEGDEMTFFIDPNNPNKVVMGNGRIAILIVMIIEPVIMIFGIVLAIRSRGKSIGNSTS